MRAYSYVDMSAAEVKKLCQKTIESVHNSRRSQEHTFISSLVLASEQSWVRRLLRMKPLKYEQVLEREQADWQSDLIWIRMMHSGSLAVAKKLLKAAKRGDPVHVSAEDLSCL